MIVTVTFNPSLDRTMAFQTLVRGEVLRADSTLEDPGGKGVNVTRFLTAHGTDSIAVLPAGGPMGHALISALDEAGIPHRAIPIAGRTRANVAVVEPDGTTTKLNEAGPVLSAAELDALVAAVAELATQGGWVVVAGSLPTGQSTDVVLRVAEVARAAGSKFGLDISGQALADGLAAKPDLIKPNEEELGEILGRELTTQAEVLAGCDEARARGAGAVICSLGSKGAVLVDAQRQLARHGTQGLRAEHGRRRRQPSLRLPARGWFGPGRPSHGHRLGHRSSPDPRDGHSVRRVDRPHRRGGERHRHCIRMTQRPRSTP